MQPVVIVNLKTYKQGEKVVKLVKELEKASKKIIVGVQASDVYEVSKASKLKVFAQHVDAVEKGRHTGFILPEAVKKDGACGSFLNHSEHKLSFSVLKKSIVRCREVGLKTAVFAGSLVEARRIERLGVDYLIYEPAELVGGNVSVSKAKPEIISKIVNALSMKVLVGAGIKSKEDVKVAMDLGAGGIAVSSGVVKAKNPGKKLKELVE